MQKKKFDICTNENIDFDLNFDEIAYKISQILPFSSILIIGKEQDFFHFGWRFCSLLRGLGLKPISLIYNQNIEEQICDLTREYPFEKRGVIFFCKQALKTFLDTDVQIEKVFFVQTNCNTYQIFLGKNALTKRVHYFFNRLYFDISIVRKSLSVKTLHLIDYAFRNALFDYRVDTLFFSYLKKKLVSALMFLESEQINKSELYFLDLELDYLFAKSDYVFCSANVCAYLSEKSFFDLDACFYFSGIIIKECKYFLSGKMQKENLNYSERASIISLFLRKDKYQVLTHLNAQVSLVKNTNLNGIKKQIEKLVLLYQKFSKKIENAQVEELINEHGHQIIARLSGDTEYSINCMTAFRESITL